MVLIMIEELMNIFNNKYDIEYTPDNEVIIHTKIRLKDFQYIRKFLNVNRIYYKNLKVESW